MSSEPREPRAETAGAFAVELPVFVGPVRLLADLILEQKIDVCDVPIATVTDRFLAHAKDAEGWSLEEATWFLAVVRGPARAEGRAPDAAARDRSTRRTSSAISPDLVYARSLELAAFRRWPSRSRAGSRTRPCASRARPGRRRSSRTCTRTSWRR